MENLDIGNFKWLLVLAVLYFIAAGAKEKIKSSSKKKKKLRGIKTYTEKGELVKSKAEARIANYLNFRNVEYIYEKKIILEGITIRPDFYLPKYNVHIEYFGWYGVKTDYTENAKDKLRLYRRNKIKVISIFPEEYRELEKFLFQKINWLKFKYLIQWIFEKLISHKD